MPQKTLSRAGIIVVVFVLLLFFYVYQKIQILRLGYKVRTVERKIGALEEENSILQLNISRLISPERITAEVRKLGIELVPPKEKQIIRVK